MTNPPAPVVRRAYLVREGSVIGGVASGVAEHLRIPVLWVRIFFVIAAIANGFGVIVYLGLWFYLPAAPSAPQTAPGLDAASRQGRRPAPPRTIAEYGLMVAFGAIALGGLALLTGATGTMFTVLPTALGICGLAVLWQRSVPEQRDRWLDPERSASRWGPWTAIARVLAGAGLLVIAVFTIAIRTGGLSAALNVAVASVLGIVGIGFIVGPWLLRVSRDLAEERAARARAQERADVAAHLHDSVLQTLALIQKSAADQTTVAKLARAQERDLRAWLFESPGDTANSLVAALRTAAAQIEDSFGVPVEVIAVGDLELPDAAGALVQAAREAMSNAARHSGAAKVDVYVEVAGPAADVFVRDRGRGFDLDAIPADRAGVRHSIIGRMERHGGRATLRSTPGRGTEIILHWEPQEG